MNLNSKVKELISGEFIGSSVKVHGKPIEGKVIDETKNTLIVETAYKKRKVLIKKNNVFDFIINNDIIRIDGKFLVARPEDRIKIKLSQINKRFK